MKVFVLQIINDNRARQYPNYYGCYTSIQGYVVLANSETEARSFLAASDPYYKEGQGQWLDPLASSCEEIHHTGQGEPRIIMSDNPTGQTMVMLRKWEAVVEHGLSTTKIIFECPFFDELIMPKGQLTPHFECHALWDYYGNAAKAFDMAERNIVYEDEQSRVFTIVTARQLFESIAKKHGVKPADMVNFWPHVDKQRIAMGGVEGLPEQFKFKYWGH